LEIKEASRRAAMLRKKRNRSVSRMKHDRFSEFIEEVELSWTWLTKVCRSTEQKDTMDLDRLHLSVVVAVPDD
jgi:hypothetical protein